MDVARNGEEPSSGLDDVLPSDNVKPLGETAAIVEGDIESDDEEIPDDDAVAWVKDRVTLKGFTPAAWREDHNFVIADFLASPSITRLVMYIDAELGICLHTDTVPPLGRVQQLQYFIKDPNRVLITLQDMAPALQYGVLNGVALDAILQVMSNVYLPTFLSNRSWPQSVRKEFSGQLHKFMANLTETANHAKGHTVLYFPNEDLSDTEQSVADKDLVQRLESTLIHWTRQIKEVVTNQETSQHVDSAGPLEEIEFWRSRTVDLLGIRQQLERDGVVDIVRILRMSGSSYLRPFETLKDMIQAGSDEANDNLKFLSTLQDPCRKLGKSPPVEISPILPDVLNRIRMIWSISKFYNTEERLTGLLRKVSNQIIVQCSAEIDLNEIFHGDVSISMARLHESIHCGVEWRNMYEKTKAAVARFSNGKTWNFDSSSIFAQIEAFVQRCRELLEVCEGQVQFARKSSRTAATTTDADADKHESEGDQSEKAKLPIFRGSRGPEIEKSLFDIEEAFEKHIDRLRRLDYNILDVKATNWHDDYNFFKNGVKDLEVMMTNVISSAFDSVATAEAGIELLESFYSLAKRPSMKHVMKRKASEVYNMFKAELLSVKRDFDRSHANPPLPPCQPRFAGRALWARGLSKRIEQLHALLNAPPFLAGIHIREADDAALVYEQVSSVLEAYQRQMHSEWVAYLDAQQATASFEQRLEQPLLIRATAATNGAAAATAAAAADASAAATTWTSELKDSRIEGNFDKVLLRVFKEVRYWNMFKGSDFAIPYAAQEISSQHETMRVLRENVMFVVRDYNAVVDWLSREERRLFADHMRKVGRRIMPGLTKLTWSKRHIKEYFVRSCREHCMELLSVMRAFHSNHVRILSCCHRISQTLLIVIEKNTIYTDEVFAAKQERHREHVQEVLVATHAEIVASMNSSYEIFREAPSDVQREWASYIRKMDRRVEASLRQTVKKSLLELSKAINGDSKNEPNALFNVAMILDESSVPATVAFRPTMIDLTTLVNEISRQLITTIRVVPRLADVLEYKRKRKGQAVSMNLPSDSSTNAAAAGTAAVTAAGAEEKLKPSTEEVTVSDSSEPQNFYDDIANDDEVLKTFVTIIQGMRDVSTEIHDLVSYWKDAYKATWELDKDAYMRRYASTKRPLSSYDIDITRYRGLQEDILSEDPARTVRFISVNCSQLKASLVAHCLEWQKRLMTLLHNNASTELRSLHELLESTSASLMKEPVDLDELGAGLELLAKMKKEAPSIEARFDPLHDMFRTLNKFDVPISDEEKEQLDSLRDEWEQFGGVMHDSEKMLAVAKQAMKRGLELALDSLNDAVSQMRQEFLKCDAFQAPMPDQGEPDIDGAVATIAWYRGKLLENRQQADSMRSGLQIFGLQAPVYKDADDTERDLGLLDTIWDIARDWMTLWNSWKLGVFSLLDSETMDNSAIEMQTRIIRLAKTMKKWPVWNSMRLRVDQFRVMMPLIRDLKNEAMRERHWLELKDEIGKHDFDPNDNSFTLSKLFELGIHQHADTINALSSIASREFGIEQSLADIGTKWKEMKFVVVEYKENYHKVIETDDVFQVLEDHQVSLSTMKNSPHYLTFEHGINSWIRSLNDVAECIETVLGVQRQWMYLESIFICSEDIRKQLPAESAQFENVNASWTEIMSRWNDLRDVLACTQIEGLLDRLLRMKAMLEKVQKSLDQYLEKKRQIFPRFYFLSDDDLLEILGQTRDPLQVQKHVKKCFAGIQTLELSCKERSAASSAGAGAALNSSASTGGISSAASANGGGGGGNGNRATTRVWEAIGMNDPEGEKVRFLAPVAVQGAVELWLLKVEKAMRETLRKLLSESVASVLKSLSKRENWIRSCIGQLLITSGQVAWTNECTRAVSDQAKARKALKTLRNRWYRYLERLTVLIRGDLTTVERLKLVALITIEVHARDVIERMLKRGVSSVNDFEWTSQLRFYFDKDEGEFGECTVRQTNTSFGYGYEYQGNNGRLVVTPLTDRCYLTLTTAMHLHLGGSPQGPAGTGKTETVKDLGKAMGNFVIVFNCSDAMDYKSLATLFSGLAQTGAWGCFDEFNRILIEVLSVVAQQISSIFAAVAGGREYFNFEGSNIHILPTVGIFITMNPGYAGRTELPDNLKSLFRPVSMMIPDFALIAEIMLQAEGFKEARVLAKKIITLYGLMQQQFSKQHHYDFGLRAVKSVLTRAGSIYREVGETLPEEMVLVRALRDMNIPKFIADDNVLFAGLMQDLFPNLEVAAADMSSMEDIIKAQLIAEGLQPHPVIISKVIQLFESKRTRHGNMIVGETLSGKSTTWRILKASLTALAAKDPANYRKVETFVINPKTVNNNELYGSYDLNTREWSDGIIASLLRKCCTSENGNEKWIVLDGPVDTLWIESMNTVLDDNKVLTLINGDRIALTPEVSLLFEVRNLTQASPATVSRAGMVYLDYDGLGWQPFVTSWLATKETAVADLLRDLFERIAAPLLAFKRKHVHELIAITDFNAVRSLCRIFDSLATPANGVDGEDMATTLRLVESWFLFALVWSIGGAADEPGRLRIDEFLRDAEANFPGLNTVYDYVVDGQKRDWAMWEERVPKTWAPAPDTPFHSILVPTVDTVRNSFVVNALVANAHPLLLVGTTGTGRTVLVQALLSQMDENTTLTLTINFSSATSSNITQEVLESRLEKRQRNNFGPAGGRSRLVVFIDDLNMPSKDLYGSQPPIELLRQWIDYGCWYDRSKQTLKNVLDMQLMAAMGPPGGGRSEISQRMLSRFNLINFTFPSTAQIKRIYGSILAHHLQSFDKIVKPLAGVCTEATLEVYRRVVDVFLPTPSKCHYVFNLRDMSRVTQGLLQSDRQAYDTRESLIRLWVHECMRVFHDRLVDAADRLEFKAIVNTQLDTLFSTSWETLFGDFDTNPLFGTFLSEGGADGEDGDEATYEEMNDHEQLKEFLNEKLEYYNMFPGNAAMDLVLFEDAIEHVCRIFRIISQPRGNALLIGVGGSGRQSLTRLSAYVAEVQVVQIEISKSYRSSDFHEDLKQLYLAAGVERKRSVFLLTDTQLIEESFLEDINNILSSGEIPNLFPPDELVPILDALRPQAHEDGHSESEDGLYTYFIERVRNHVNVVLCMSPIGDVFRERIRMYPALVNNTSINLFSAWPEKALREVARKFLADVVFTPVSPAATPTPDQTKTTKTTTMAARVAADDVALSAAKQNAEHEAAVQEQLASVFCTAHMSVEKAARDMASELRRHTYVTPTNYLDLVTGYRALLHEKRESLGEAADKLKNGLEKLDESREQVAEMTIELEQKRRFVAQKKLDCEKLLVEIVSQQRSADEQRKQVEIEASKTAIEEQECQSIASDAQADLDKALPALERALEALDKLDKASITEVKSYAKPPPIVGRVMSAVMVVMGKEASWASAKKELSDANFLLRLKTFNKDNISTATLKKISKYTTQKDFSYDNVVKKSQAAAALCDWVSAMEIYANTFRTVAPKRAALKEATSSLEIKQKQLRIMQDKLQKVKEQVAMLEARYEASESEKNQLRRSAEQLELKLSRADKLIGGLAGERLRWQASIADLEQQLSFVVGDCAVAAAFLSYAGPFVSDYRHKLVTTYWLGTARRLKVACSPEFSFARFLSDPADVREWNIQGLPTDDSSTENGVLVTRGNRWPLMIDPQGQANKWIKRMHGEALRVVDTKSDFGRVLENAVQFGLPVLMQDIGEDIDPSLEPILIKSIILEGNHKYIKIGDKQLDYNDDFLFFLTTRLQNPHYPPEICAKATIVNFAVKEKGLEDQLLGFVVKMEQPKLEEDKNALVISVAANKRKLVELEDSILTLLKTASGSLLDDEGLINTLQQSKSTSEQVTEDVRVGEETEKQIDLARESYRLCAVRSSLLYFVLNDLSLIDPMYQFSLDAYIDLFQMSIEKSRKPKGNLDLKERIKTLNAYHTMSVYKFTCRGLFAKHKLLFSFQMCIRKLQNEKRVNAEEYQFFLRGGIVMDRSLCPKNPVSDGWLSDVSWDNVCELDKLPNFKNIVSSFEQNQRGWRAWCFSDTPETAALPNEWENKLDEMQRMVILRSLRPDRVVFSTRRFVEKNLGPAFVEPPPMDLEVVLADSTPYTPIIFVLSAGVDPSGMLNDLAVSSQRTVEQISLGQGQEGPARRLLEQGVKNGFWVFFANCHLSISWMPELEALIEKYCSGPTPPHDNFRLWLSSDPHPKFPIPILQRGLKITTEPPSGLRANLLRLYSGVKPERFANSKKPSHYRKLVFSLCWFHSVLLERRKFGSLGWNIPYGFNDSDFGVCENILRLYLDEYDETPWDALKYLIAEANYGGRVTDDRDRRLLNVYVDQFFNERAISEQNFKLSSIDTYKIPDENDTGFVLSYLRSLPSSGDHPEAFGQHPNADISSQLQDTNTLLSTVLSLQPRTVDAGARSREEVTLDIVEALLEQVPQPMDLETILEAAPADKSPLRVVLVQEVQRYNGLLRLIRRSLTNLKKGIMGLVVISSELEDVYNALFDGLVPDMWKQAYPSLKPLGLWTSDLCLRVEQLVRWSTEGPPKVFWLAGFTFPTGFLTALLQSTARRNGVPIDELSWDFSPCTLEASAITAHPKEGAYIRGLFLEGARWDFNNNYLMEAAPMELNSPMPVVHFKPVDNKRGGSRKGFYSAPLYLYPIRTGTRERPSFMLNVELKSGPKDPTHWTKRGTALLLALAT